MMSGFSADAYLVGNRIFTRLGSAEEYARLTGYVIQSNQDPVTAERVREIVGHQLQVIFAIEWEGVRLYQKTNLELMSVREAYLDSAASDPLRDYKYEAYIRTAGETGGLEDARNIVSQQRLDLIHILGGKP